MPTTTIPSSAKRRKMMTHSSSQSTNSSIHNLPDDLLRKILCLLPSKSAVQCKAVCKRWFSIISHPYFVHCSIQNHLQHEQSDASFSFMFMHLHKDSQRGAFINVQSTSSFPHLQCPGGNLPHMLNFLPCFKEEHLHPVRVAAYFNDLIVCSGGDSFRSNVFYICNPLTRQWSMLPPAPGYHKDVQVGFVCYPCNSTNTKYSYKVVIIPQFTDFSSKFNVEIFCSESGKWTQSEVSAPRGLTPLHWCHCVIAYNGILHWVDVRSRSIVAYDPLNNIERCRIIDPPTGAHPDGVINCFGVCRRSLRMAKLTTVYDDGDISLWIWELEDYDAGKWRLKHKVDLMNMVSEDERLVKRAKRESPCVNILAFHPFDADIVYLCFTPYLVSCNLRMGRLQVVSKLQQGGQSVRFIFWGNFYTIVHPWWPTPVPPLAADAFSCC